MAVFMPDLFCRRVTDLTAESLRARGVRGLLLDIDNTLTDGHKTGRLAPGAAAWLERMKGEGFSLILTSNAKPERAASFAAACGLPCLPGCRKPLPGGIRRAAARIGLTPREVAVVGDQFFTDLLAGRLSGAVTVLVTPWQRETGRAFRFKRALEKPLWRRVERHMSRQGKDA